MIRRDQARGARREIEDALDAVASSSGWPWMPQLSLWADALLVLEEATSS